MAKSMKPAGVKTATSTVATKPASGNFFALKEIHLRGGVSVSQRITTAQQTVK